MGLKAVFKKVGGFFKKAGPVLDAVTESPLKDVIPVVGKADAVKDLIKGIASNTDLAKELKKWPEDRLNQWLVRLGKAFGPPGIIHFSELSPAAQQALLERAPILKTTHTDWVDPWKWVPRRTVCWVGGIPPRRHNIVVGSVSDASIKADGTLLPIPAPGDHYVIPGYMAAQTSDGWHTRLGWRWDDVDGYWDLSAAFKKYDY